MNSKIASILLAFDGCLSVCGILQAADSVLVGQWPGYTRGQASAVAVVGNYAYVKAGGFHSIDISMPASPHRVGGCELAGQGQLAVSGSYAYYASGEALRVVDISDPRNPRQVARYSPAGNGVAVSGSYAYLSTWENGAMARTHRP